MQRVKRTTSVASLPADPVGGTPGFFAAPNPAGGVAATVPGYEWYNNVQEEILAVIESQGLTANGGDRTQLLQAILLLAGGKESGQCRLIKSGSNLLLARYNGSRLPIGGVSRTIPQGGVSLAPTGATPGTVYFIYAYMNGGALALEASTTSHSPDTTTGVEIKTGDPTRTLVGQAYCTTGPAWISDASHLGVLSWFNRTKKALYGAFTANWSTSSTAFIEVNNEIRVNFLAWADSAPQLFANGGWSLATGGPAFGFIGVDGISLQSGGCGINIVGAGQQPFAAHSGVQALAEGVWHYATLAAAVPTGGGTLTFTGGANDGGQRVNLTGFVEG